MSDPDPLAARAYEIARTRYRQAALNALRRVAEISALLASQWDTTTPTSAAHEAGRILTDAAELHLRAGQYETLCEVAFLAESEEAAR